MSSRKSEIIDGKSWLKWKENSVAGIRSDSPSESNENGQQLYLYRAIIMRVLLFHITGDWFRFVVKIQDGRRIHNLESIPNAKKAKKT